MKIVTRQLDRRYVAKINGKYFSGLSKEKVYADSTAQFAFHKLVNICAKPDGMAAFEFSDNIENAKKMDFFEVSHNFIQMVHDRTRYEYLPPIETLEFIEVE